MVCDNEFNDAAWTDNRNIQKQKNPDELESIKSFFDIYEIDTRPFNLGKLLIWVKIINQVIISHNIKLNYQLHQSWPVNVLIPMIFSYLRFRWVKFSFNNNSNKNNNKIVPDFSWHGQWWQIYLQTYLLKSFVSIAGFAFQICHHSIFLFLKKKIN